MFAASVLKCAHRCWAVEGVLLELLLRSSNNSFTQRRWSRGADPIAQSHNDDDNVRNVDRQ